MLLHLICRRTHLMISTFTCSQDQIENLLSESEHIGQRRKEAAEMLQANVIITTRLDTVHTITPFQSFLSASPSLIYVLSQEAGLARKNPTQKTHT